MVGKVERIECAQSFFLSIGNWDQSSKRDRQIVMQAGRRAQDGEGSARLLVVMQQMQQTQPDRLPRGVHEEVACDRRQTHLHQKERG